MRLFVRTGCWLFLASLLAAALSVNEAAGQTVPNAEPALSPARANVTGEEIFADLLRHNEMRRAALREYSALRTYSVIDPHGKVHARETVRMNYVAPDQKTFVTLNEEGSSLIRHLVLNRLMESEASAAAGKDQHDSAITPANYTFRLLGEDDVSTHHCFVVEALPKRVDKYLFVGNIWIDDKDFAVVKIAGHPARKLSYWITRADFVRQYEKVGDFWLPFRDDTTVDVRLYGEKILRIEHHTSTVNGVTGAALTAQSPATGLSNNATVSTKQ